MKVLVVDDEPALRTALERALALDAFEVRLAVDGRAALDHLVEQRVDAVVLDVAMPGLDGLEVCRRLRAAGDRTPVLMLTARDAVDDRVAGLEAGADDYLVKPFALRELKARLRALVRRAEPATGAVMRFADLELDPAAREVRRGGRPIELSRTEFSLLELFLARPRQVMTRSEIFERVWGYDFGPDSNSLEVYVSYLRRKLEAADEPRLLHTVRGVGYVLRERGQPDQLALDGRQIGEGLAVAVQEHGSAARLVRREPVHVRAAHEEAAAPGHGEEDRERGNPERHHTHGRARLPPALGQTEAEEREAARQAFHAQALHSKRLASRGRRRHSGLAQTPEQTRRARVRRKTARRTGAAASTGTRGRRGPRRGGRARTPAAARPGCSRPGSAKTG